MKHAILLAVVLSLAACSTRVVTQYTDVTALRASDLYQSDSVLAYLDRHGNTNNELAAAYFAKAEKEEDTNPEKAVYYYKRSISLQPLKSTYLRLALLLEQLERKEELNSLYSLLVYPYSRSIGNQAYETVYTFGPPDEDLFYESLVANVRAYDYLPAEALFDTEERGFNRQRIKERLKTEKRLHLDTNSLAFKEMMLQFVPYDSRKSYAHRPNVFADFVQSIRDSAGNFEIDAEAVARFDYDKYLSETSFVGPQLMLSGINCYYLKEKQEKTDTWLVYNFTRSLYFGNIKALVYAVDTSVKACPRAMRHIYHRLVTYNDTGGVIDSKIIAWHAGPTLGTCKVSGRKISITNYSRTWKHPYKYDEFDNYPTGTTKTGENTFVVNEDGTVVPL